VTAPRELPAWMGAWQSTQMDFAVLAQAWSKPGQQAIIEQYRRLFAPPSVAVTGASESAPAMDRYRRAAERHGEIVSRIAADAGRRLAAALAASGPDAPPITSLRELHALWIECGEAAWSAAARGDDFAEAQAELVAALAAIGTLAPAR
jgi:Poly(R)-hydroxyalkanoic acid synthase subunit (PHA_synth_III_E)